MADEMGYELKPPEPPPAPPPPPPPPPQAGSEVSEDVRANRAMAILAYMGPLVIVPLLAAKESPFARHHANQGFLLFLGEVIFWVVCAILMVAFAPLMAFGFMVWVASIGSFLAALVWVVFMLFSLVGIRHALAGTLEVLPLIGHSNIIL
jgi:uncharacterized membrane protein